MRHDKLLCKYVRLHCSYDCKRKQLKCWHRPSNIKWQCPNWAFWVDIYIQRANYMLVNCRLTRIFHRRTYTIARCHWKRTKLTTHRPSCTCWVKCWKALIHYLWVTSGHAIFWRTNCNLQILLPHSFFCAIHQAKFYWRLYLWGVCHNIRICECN